MYAIADNLVCTLFLKVHLAPAVSIVRFCIKGALDALQAWVDRARRSRRPRRLARRTLVAVLAADRVSHRPVAADPALGNDDRTTTRAPSVPAGGWAYPFIGDSDDRRFVFKRGLTQRHSRLPVMHHPIHKWPGRDL